MKKIDEKIKKKREKKYCLFCLGINREEIKNPPDKISLEKARKCPIGYAHFMRSCGILQ